MQCFSGMLPDLIKINTTKLLISDSLSTLRQNPYNRPICFLWPGVNARPTLEIVIFSGILNENRKRWAKYLYK